MAAKTTTKKITEDTIIALYMDYVLEHEEEPKGVYKFCKTVGIEEDEFYQHFGSVSTIKSSIWDKFYTNTVSLLEKNKDYSSFANRDKMLSFYFTFLSCSLKTVVMCFLYCKKPVVKWKT